jgi:hypothetical protein
VKLEGFLYTDHGQKRRTSEDYKVQQSHIKDLLQQIQTLEKTQPPLFQRMPSSPLSPKDIQEIHAIAIQAKMSTLELEQLIEWEAYSFTRQETDALAAWVHRLVISNGELAPPQRDAHRTSNPYTTALAPRVRVSGYVPEQRLGWHIDELQLFVGYCFGVAPRILATQPLKVPSGKYVETLTVERTQHELISEMAVALSRLPLRTAYAKIVTATPGKESVWMGKIQTFAFEQVFAGIPSGQLIDVSSLAPSTASKAQILKKRSAIEVEIRARQGNWRRRVGNDAPPPQHSDDDSLRSLLAGESGEDCVPSLTPSVPLPPAEEPPPRSEDVSPAQAEIVDVAILIDGVEFAEEPFTITEDAAEPPPNQEQQPLATTARKKTPKKVPRAPVPGFKLVSVQFYESGKEYTRQGERQYATHFSKRTARYVNADLVLRNRLYKKRRQTFHVEVRYHNPDGTLFEGTSHYDGSLTSSYKEWGLSVGWGCDESEEWELGTYRVVILIDGVEIGEGFFIMTDSVELPPPPPTVVPATTSAEPPPGNGQRQRERSSLSVIWDALAWCVKKLAGSGSA